MWKMISTIGLRLLKMDNVPMQQLDLHLGRARVER